MVLLVQNGPRSILGVFSELKLASSQPAVSATISGLSGRLELNGGEEEEEEESFELLELRSAELVLAAGTAIFLVAGADGEEQADTVGLYLGRRGVVESFDAGMYTVRVGRAQAAAARSLPRARRLRSPLQNGRNGKQKNVHTFSICACHPCAGAMLIFSVSFQF